ncbi:MAG: hypothetical protein ACD_16C00093G0001 [uncultured bacterium]|nr:MAG: hypothetical protein ACD_16C00093G0001 [uncultured bacterium]OFW93649.1 MAG: hypothetical protein A2W46_03645 [Alphaproteobacteria bacterium RIFCSPHIGHO2_12_42_13]HCE95222.1 hypothetical protein [Holosporales bacterium]
MSHDFLKDTSFHLQLDAIDQNLAHQTQARGCPLCGHKLHCANYPRSPMGLPPPLWSFYEKRLSFCCAKCRKRTTPPSVKFFGLRWYPAFLFILVSAFMRGMRAFFIVQMKRHFGISVGKKTWKRWNRWWNTFFVFTPFWKKAKGLVPQALGREDNKILPRALLKIFKGTFKEKMILTLLYLSPFTRREAG